jgi:hypothetical protein
MSASARKAMPAPTDDSLPTGIDGLFPMTEEELLAEWRVIYATRIGNLCGSGTPTPAQEIMARDEADAAVEMMSRYKPK